jgi:MFS family permease
MPSPAATDRRARWAVAAVFLANGIVIGSWAALIPRVEAQLGIGHATLGLALLCMALGALVAMPIGGAAIARLGSAAVTRASTAVWCLTFPLAVAAPSPVLLAAALFVFGAANGVLDVAMNAHGVLVENRIRRPVMSSFHGMFSLGGLLGAALAAVVMAKMSAVGFAVLVAVVAAALAAPAFLAFLPSGADRGAGGSAFALPSRAALGLGALCFLAMTSEGAVLDWSALHLEGSLEVGAGLAATGFAAYSATMAAGRFLGDWLRGHFGAVALVRSSALLATVGLLAALVVPVPLVAIAGFAVSGLGLSNLVPIFFGAAGRIPGESAGASIAAVATVGYCGFLTGPPVIGLAAEATNLRLALGLIVLACLAIAIFSRAAAPGGRRGGAQPRS